MNTHGAIRLSKHTRLILLFEAIYVALGVRFLRHARHPVLMAGLRACSLSGLASLSTGIQ
jgi:hypothetical protein